MTPPRAAKAIGTMRRRLVRRTSVMNPGSSHSSILFLPRRDVAFERAALCQDLAPARVAEFDGEARRDEDDDKALDGVDHGAVDAGGALHELGARSEAGKEQGGHR